MRTRPEAGLSHGLGEGAGVAWARYGRGLGRERAQSERDRRSIVAGRGHDLSGVRGRASCGLAGGRREGAGQGATRARGRALQGRGARAP